MDSSTPPNGIDWDEEVISMSPPESPSRKQHTTDEYSYRRELECNLVLKFDCDVPNPREGGCYYLISSPWFEDWQGWVNGSRGMPGPVGNRALMRSNGLVRDDLKKVRDYRAVNGGVYWVFKTLHGSDCEVRSWNTDWEGEQAGGTKVDDYARVCKMDAEEAVRLMKMDITNKGGRGGVKKAKRPKRGEDYWCFCITESFLSSVIECLFTCCNKAQNRYKKVEEDLSERVSMLARGEEEEWE